MMIIMTSTDEVITIVENKLIDQLKE